MLTISNTLNSDPRRSDGFTLVEVMVATLIFAMVLLGVLGMMISAQRMGEAARNRMDAMQHARATLEDLVGSSYGSSGLNVGTHSVSRGGLSGTYTVTEINLNEMKEISLSYSYRSFGNLAQVQLLGRISNALH